MPATTSELSINGSTNRFDGSSALSLFNTGNLLGDTASAAPTLLAQQGRGLPVVATPGAPASNPAAAQSTITVDGVSTPRFPSQAGMAKVRTEAEIKQLGITPANTRFYVIDNFAISKVQLGVGAQAVKTMHGEVVAGIINAAMKGQAGIERINVVSPADGSISPDALTKAVRQVIQLEAARQKTTVDKVDLSRITINMSLGSQAGAPKDAAFNAAVQAFTERGGSMFATAGNANYSGFATNLPNTSVVDGSNEGIGSVISQQPLPSTNYSNVGVIAGSDWRSVRLIDASSQSVIAPSVLTTRVNDAGAVEFKDSTSASGWSKLVDASKTVSAPVPAATGLEGTAPRRYVTAAEGQAFETQVGVLQKAAIARSSVPGAAALSDLKPAERAAYSAAVRTAFYRSFGLGAVMSLPAYQTYAGLAAQSPMAQRTASILPVGVKAQEVLLSAEQVVLGTADPSRQDCSFFVLDSGGKLKTLQVQGNVTEGTSWAAPYAAAQTALERAERVQQGKGKG